MKPTSCLFVSDGMGIMCRRKRIVGIEASRKVVKRTINHCYFNGVLSGVSTSYCFRLMGDDGLGGGVVCAAAVPSKIMLLYTDSCFFMFIVQKKEKGTK